MSVRGLLTHPRLALLCRALLGGVFLWAGVTKALDPAAFGLEIARYRILPHEAINVVALTLPWLELVAAVALLLGLYARAAALLCGAMMVVFIAALGSALSRGLDISCGCFGAQPGAARISGLTLARDLLWLAWAAQVALFDRGVAGLDGVLERRRVRQASPLAAPPAP